MISYTTRDQLADDEYIGIHNTKLKEAAQECFKRGWEQAVNSLRAHIDESTPDIDTHWASIAADYLED